jgi:hypothetical protein
MKRSGGRVFTIVDGGMNDLIRPSWYQAEHKITVVSTPEPGTNTETVDVVGPLCEAGDVFGLERELRSPRRCCARRVWCRRLRFCNEFQLQFMPQGSRGSHRWRPVGSHAGPRNDD